MDLPDQRWGELHRLRNAAAMAGPPVGRRHHDLFRWPVGQHSQAQLGARLHRASSFLSPAPVTIAPPGLLSRSRPAPERHSAAVNNLRTPIPLPKFSKLIENTN